MSPRALLLWTVTVAILAVWLWPRERAPLPDVPPPPAPVRELTQVDPPATPKPERPLKAPVRPVSPLLQAGFTHRLRIERASLEFLGTTDPVARLAAQLHVESAWNPKAVSPAGATGLAQFMPPTAAAIGRKHPSLWPPDPLSPQWAIRAQAALLADIDPRWAGADACQDWAFSLSAYNGGERLLRVEQSRAEQPNVWFGATGTEPHRARRQSAYTENRNYVRRILLDVEHRYIAIGWPGIAVCARG